MGQLNLPNNSKETNEWELFKVSEWNSKLLDEIENGVDSRVKTWAQPNLAQPTDHAQPNQPYSWTACKFCGQFGQSKQTNIDEISMYKI